MSLCHSAGHLVSSAVAEWAVVPEAGGVLCSTPGVQCCGEEGWGSIHAGGRRVVIAHLTFFQSPKKGITSLPAL